MCVYRDSSSHRKVVRKNHVCGSARPSSPSPKKQLHRVNRDNYLSDLMDCKVIDKHFETEHQFQPVAPRPYLPSISYEKAALYMQEGVCKIESEFCYRTLYRSDEPFASIDQSVLDRLISNGKVYRVTDVSARISVYKAV